MLNNVGHDEKWRGCRLPKKTVLSVALIAAFGAMTPLAIAEVPVTVYGGTEPQDYTITTGSDGVQTNLAVGGVVASTGSQAAYVHGNLGTLTNSGGISANAYGINNAASSIHSLINSGNISASAIAIWSHDTAAIDTLINSGNIFGGVGIENASHSAITVLTNSGNIQGSSGIINQTASTIDTISNRGRINATQTGILNTDHSSIGSISNSGSIMGRTFAIFNGIDNTISGITNAGLVAGNIENDSPVDLAINGGSDAIFGTLTGYGGAMGSLTNTASDVIFSTGNILLNDNVYLDSDYTLRNTGAVLQVNNPVTISGNYKQSAAATLLIGVADSAVTQGAMTSDTGYGRLVVSGSAVIEAGSNVTLQKTASYSFAAGQRFVVVDAALNGTNYNETKLNYAIAGISGAVLHGEALTPTAGKSDLVVSVVSLTPVATGSTDNASGGTAAGSGTTAGGTTAGSTAAGETTSGTTATSTTSTTTENTATTGTSPVITTSASTPAAAPTKTPATTRDAVAVLTGLAAYSGYTEDALLNLYNAGQALNNGSAEEANKAAAQLSPVAPAHTIRVAALPTTDTLNIINAHMDIFRLAQLASNGNGNSGVATGENAAQIGIWGQAYGGHAIQKARDEVNGYTSNYAGLLLGIDKALNDQWRAGGAFSYSNTAMYSTGSTTGDATHIDNYGFFGYASYTAPRWYANLSAGVAAQHYNESRAIDFTGFSGNARGSFGGTQWVARGEAGYPLALGSATLTPLASLTYAYLHQNSYTESGGNGAALHVGMAHATSVKTDIGAKLDQAFSTRYGVLVPSVQLAWRHEYVRSKTTVDAVFAADPTGETAFSTQGARPLSDSALLTAGVSLLRANNLSITAQYQVQAASGFFSQGGTLRLRQLF